MNTPAVHSPSPAPSIIDAELLRGWFCFLDGRWQLVLMSDSSVQKVLAFNRELAALSATGLPLDLGFGTRESLPARLEKINHNLINRSAGDERVTEQVLSDTGLPLRYRSALKTWLQCDDPAVALDSVTVPADSRDELRQSIAYALTYPLIVFVLGYLAFLYLCSVTAPKMEAMYAQLLREPGESLSWLRGVRESLPIWGPLVPLLLVAALLWWHYRSARLTWRFLPGASRYYGATRNAALARRLACMMESGCSLEQALQLTWPLSTDRSARGVSVNELPRLLQWAIEGDLGGESRPRVLRFVADLYHQTAERQRSVWRVAIPTICGVLLGGAFVFGYGLSLFLPIIDLMNDVSLPAAGAY